MSLRGAAPKALRLSNPSVNLSSVRSVALTPILDLPSILDLSKNRYVDIKELIGYVEGKLIFRGKKLTDIKKEFLRKKRLFNKLWQMRLSSQMTALPEFEQVYREVQRELRQIIL